MTVTSDDRPTSEVVNPTFVSNIPTVASDEVSPPISNLNDSRKSVLHQVKRTYKGIMGGLTVIATLGGAYGVYQLITGNNSIQKTTLAEKMVFTQTHLLEGLKEGILTQEQYIKLVENMSRDAFPDAEKDASSLTSHPTPQSRFEEAAINLAQSGDSARRNILALIAVEGSRSQGLDMLASAARTAQDWREVGELAYPWDTARAIEAYTKSAELDGSDIWTLIHLSRLHHRGGDTEAALRVALTAASDASNDQDKSVALNEVGTISKLQGDWGAAQEAYEKSYEIAKTLVASDPKNDQYQNGLSIRLEGMGDIADIQGDLSAALDAYEKALEIRQVLAAANPSNAQYQNGLSITYEKIGFIAQVRGDLSAALSAYEKSHEISKTLAATYPSHARYKRGLASTHSKIGNIDKAQGDLVAALKSYRKSLKITEVLAAADPSDARYQQDLASTFSKVGDITKIQGDLVAALKSYEKSLKIREVLAAADPSNSISQLMLSANYGAIGRIKEERGALSAALEAYVSSLAILEVLAVTVTDPADSRYAHYQVSLSIMYERIGVIAEGKGNLSAALTAYEKRLGVMKSLAVVYPSNALYQEGIMVSHITLAEMGGDNELGHWKKAYQVLKALDDEGGMVQFNQDTLKYLAQKAGAQ